MRECRPHCFSTLNHNLAYCYDAARAFKCVSKQALHGFRGTTGDFDEQGGDDDIRSSAHAPKDSA